MDRINSPDGQFHNGDPTTGQRGTRITAEWLNGVQEELIHVIEAGGRAQPDFANVSQLLAAIRAVSQAEARAAFQRGAQPTGTAAGSENDLAVSTAPPVDELLDGLELRVRAGSANTRRQVTIRIGDLPPCCSDQTRWPCTGHRGHCRPWP
ncbi:hypothetical protein [Microvirgula aerodenitrificans]|uniref:hypothetical protein n=1 Tax=Microvirgula aerodenitrificans TaxID=57480 RepID=UPI0012EBA247|nr:hypothetical protein [Microvirgula aerodenitrificans]